MSLWISENTYFCVCDENLQAGMGKATLSTLLSLRTAFEAEEDWVAVGHVEYLLDRMASERRSDQAQILLALTGATLH